MTREEKSQLSTATRVVLLTALYFLGGLLGKKISFLAHSQALVWPPSGIALAAILLFGYRFWPGIALGAVLFSFIGRRAVRIFHRRDGGGQHHRRHRLRVPAEAVREF